MNLQRLPDDFDQLADSLAQLQKLRKFEVDSGVGNDPRLVGWPGGGKDLNWPRLFDGLSQEAWAMGEVRTTPCCCCCGRQRLNALQPVL